MTALADPVAARDQAEVLKPYVPRLLVEWVRETPRERHRVVDGSLAFVDISGFTALTERLARRGKIGAELMRDTLDGVFRALLDDAYDAGAGLLKWGGDALLLLFDGPGHEQRAAWAAWEMQHTLDRVGRLRVAGGSVRLRMSVGVTSGPIDFFTAGSVHRELLLVGPVATETVRLEGLADAGQIAVGEALAQALDPGCVGVAETGDRFLIAAPEVPRERAPDVGEVALADIESCIPVAAREHVLLERSEPEHRTITAAFIDLMDTDVLLAELGPEAFAGELDARISAVQEAALRHDVPFYETDIGKGSVKALLTGGAPSGTGHDEERTLRALREVLEQPGAIPVRVGVNTGKVFTGDFGPAYRRAYRVFGDAINTAARVMSHAQPGQILATAPVLERSRTLFRTTPIEPFRVKGKAEPLQAFVVGPVGGSRAERFADTPLVGRDAELRVLLDALEAARAGRGAIVEISGAMGTGKSRLVAELARRAADARVLRGRCDRYESATPYRALRAPLRAALGIDAAAGQPEAARRVREAVAGDEVLERWAPLAGMLVGADLPATPETRRLEGRFLADTLADVASRLLDRVLGDSVRVLVLEDVEHADSASADLLRRLAQAGAGLRQLVVVTHSTPAVTWAGHDDDGPPALSLSLLPLRERDLAEIVAAATEQEPLSPHDADEVVRRSQGNVLFLFELLDAVRERGAADGLPDSVEALVAGEIDRLSASDRALLRYASVFGVAFGRAELAAALHGEVVLDEALWSRLGALVEPEQSGGMRFRNTIVRDVAYEGLPYRRRRELHGRVAEAIEAVAADASDEQVAALALHFSAAQRADKAWHYSRLAGDRAKALAAPVDATRHYERALVAARRLRTVPAHEKAEVWRSLGAVLDSSGRFDAAHRALRRSTALYAGAPALQVVTLEERSRARVRSGAYGGALRELTAGLAVAETLPPSERPQARARLLAERAELRLLQGHPREALQLGHEAMAEGERVGELEAVARACSALDGAYQMLGEPAKAVHERRALEIYTELGRTRTVGIIQMNLGVQAYADGRWDEAVDWYQRSERDCAAAGDRQNAAIAAANLGEVLVSRGLLDEGEEVLRAARRVLRGSRLTAYALFAETQLARVALARGAATDALESLVRVADEARDVAHAGIALEITIYVAAAATAAGEPERGLALLDEASRAAGDEAALLAVPVDRVRGTALAALGRHEEAAVLLARALDQAHRQTLLYEQLLILRERAALARLQGREPPAEETGEAERLTSLLRIGEAS